MLRKLFSFFSSASKGKSNDCSTHDLGHDEIVEKLKIAINTQNIEELNQLSDEVLIRAENPEKRAGLISRAPDEFIADAWKLTQFESETVYITNILNELLVSRKEGKLIQQIPTELVKKLVSKEIGESNAGIYRDPLGFYLDSKIPEFADIILLYVEKTSPDAAERCLSYLRSSASYSSYELGRKLEELLAQKEKQTEVANPSEEESDRSSKTTTKRSGGIDR